MRVRIRVYSGSKYNPGSRTVAQCEYSIKSYEVREIPDAEIYLMGFDDVDPCGEYLTETNSVLEARLQALELLIRAYTNNNFQKRAFRAVAVAVASGNQLLVQNAHPFKVGDTLEVSESDLNAGLVTISAVSDGVITVMEELYDESGVVITKVVYPADVKQGVANMVKWQLSNGDKVGVQSETISRHSVTYFNMDGDNSIMGFPKSLLGFLKPYQRARFGQGLRV